MKNRSLPLLYLLLTVLIVASLFSGQLVLTQTPWSVVVGTVICIVLSLLLATLPAYVLAACVVGIVPAPKWVINLTQYIAYLVAGMPSILIGVIGFQVFCRWMGLGWSLLASILTLNLLLFPTLLTAFIQLLQPVGDKYLDLAKSYRISLAGFLFLLIPKLYRKQMLEILTFGMSRGLGDTAAIMLTSGALLEMPSSLFDSVRLLNFHIYMLAMEVPGGMNEAKTLSLWVVVIIFSLLFIPRLIGNKAYE